jgi:hypothetical protein
LRTNRGSKTDKRKMKAPLPLPLTLVILRSVLATKDLALDLQPAETFREGHGFIRADFCLPIPHGFSR